MQDNRQVEEKIGVRTKSGKGKYVQIYCTERKRNLDIIAEKINDKESRKVDITNQTRRQEDTPSQYLKPCYTVSVTV